MAVVSSITVSSRCLAAAGMAFWAASISAVPANGATFTTIAAFGGKPVQPAFPLGAVTFYHGRLYGTSFAGGGSPRRAEGTAYRFAPASGKLKTLLRLSDEEHSRYLANPSPLVELNGKLYATTRLGGDAGFGTIFEVGPLTGSAALLYVFAGGVDGADPTALVVLNGLLYSATSLGGAHGAGTLFAYDPSSNTKTTLHDFTTDEANVGLSLTTDGKLIYGVSYGGGTYSHGTLFKFDPISRQIAILYNFGGPTGYDGRNPLSVSFSGNALYGYTKFDVAGNRYKLFQYDLNSNGGLQTPFVFNPSVYGPIGGLCLHDGALYGTIDNAEDTVSGDDNGLIFKVDLKTHAFTTLYAFTGGADGRTPESGLTYNSGAFYGTTEYGGANQRGTLFKLVP